PCATPSKADAHCPKTTKSPKRGGGPLKQQSFNFDVPVNHTLRRPPPAPSSLRACGIHASGPYPAAPAHRTTPPLAHPPRPAHLEAGVATATPATTASTSAQPQRRPSPAGQTRQHHHQRRSSACAHGS